MSFIAPRKHHAQAYRYCKLKTTRSKQPVLQSPRERLHAPIQANSHKGTTKAPLSKQQKGSNCDSIHFQFNSITVLYATQPTEGWIKSPLSYQVKVIK